MRSTVQLIPRALMVNSDYAPRLLITSVPHARFVFVSGNDRRHQLRVFGALKVDNLRLAHTRGLKTRGACQTSHRSNITLFYASFGHLFCFFIHQYVSSCLNKNKLAMLTGQIFKGSGLYKIKFILFLSHCPFSDVLRK